jgi:hypothetical protein
VEIFLPVISSLDLRIWLKNLRSKLVILKQTATKTNPNQDLCNVTVITLVTMVTTAL